MNPNFLDFEQPIADLESKIQELQRASQGPGVNIDIEIGGLQKKLEQRTAEIFSTLSPWQISQLSRHPQRPYSLDYFELMFDEFHELAGDRTYADDAAIVGGLARLNGKACMVIGQQKGRDTKSKVKRNFGMPRPEGYRKALRLMKMAERFQLPLFTFIDTPGAYPGIGAEERGQSESIAKNIMVMSKLKTPILSVIVGEGGSGGALAIAVGNRVLMMQYSVYSVISPEGCASILWKDSTRADRAALALGLTAEKALKLGVIDEVVREPLGGAHWRPQESIQILGDALERHLNELSKFTPSELRAQRIRRYATLGQEYSFEKEHTSPLRSEHPKEAAWATSWDEIIQKTEL